MALAFPKPTVTRDRVQYKLQREADLRAAIAAVWLRDGSRCRSCHHYVTHGGSLGRRGEVHHLVKRSQSTRQRAVTANLVLLCGVCHADVTLYRLIIRGTSANGVLTFEAVE